MLQKTRNTLLFWLVAILFSLITACSIAYGTDARETLASELGVRVSSQTFASNTYQAGAW